MEPFFFLIELKPAAIKIQLYILEESVCHQIENQTIETFS